MDPQTIWIIALSIATPVAGVVGFAIQLREVKKSRLENEKLQLEIDALKVKAAIADRRIERATPAEVEKFAVKDLGILCSRATDQRRVEEVFPPEKKKSFKSTLIGAGATGAIILIIALFIAYLLYDIYRLFVWIGSNFKWIT